MEYRTEFVVGAKYLVEDTFKTKVCVCLKKDGAYWFDVGYGLLKATSTKCSLIK